MSAYSKAIAAVVATIASALVAVQTDGVITDVEWVNVAIAGVGALAVFTAPNVPFARYTKSIIASLTAVLVLLTSVITDGITSAEWWQLVVAALGALGVYSVSNSPQRGVDLSTR